MNVISLPVMTPDKFSYIWRNFIKVKKEFLTNVGIFDTCKWGKCGPLKAQIGRLDAVTPGSRRTLMWRAGSGIWPPAPGSLASSWHAKAGSSPVPAFSGLRHSGLSAWPKVPVTFAKLSFRPPGGWRSWIWKKLIQSNWFQSCLCQVLFLGVWAKTRFTKKSKNSIFPKKTRFQEAKTRFFLTIWPIFAPKIAMNHKISRKRPISDLKTAKNAKTQLSNV